MVSKVKPAVAIEIGGKLRHLKLDLNAMATYEEITGTKILGGMLGKEIGARELRALLYACLVHEDEKLTIQEVGSWITMDNAGEIAERITESIEAAMPESKGDKKKKPPLPKKPLAG